MKNLSKFLAISVLALTTIPTNVFAASETASIKASIPESLSLTLSTNALNFTLEDEDLHIDSLVATARTNAAGGYTVSFNANNEYNDLKHSNTLVADLIPSVTEDKTEATFPETAWAYSLDAEDHTFKQIPLAPENVFATTEKGENTHDFTVGVRANNLAAGDYENELIFTAVANPDPEPVYLSMQDVATWKDTLEEEQQVQVKDARDGKIYWVSKLKDGNIWMTQNLDYDLSVAANQTLTPATSNVTENRTVTPVAWGTDPNSAYYMDGGDNYFTNGITQTAGLSSLPTNSIDHHYAQGDYYSWKAATAGVGTISYTNTNNINESICPANWRLPVINYNNGAENYSFNKLTSTYGIITNSEIGASDTALLSSPLFFARGGYVDENGFNNSNAGSYRTANSTGDSLYFRSDIVSTEETTYSGYGFNVRCVAL